MIRTLVWLVLGAIEGFDQHDDMMLVCVFKEGHWLLHELSLGQLK